MQDNVDLGHLVNFVYDAVMTGPSPYKHRVLRHADLLSRILRSIASCLDHPRRRGGSETGPTLDAMPNSYGRGGEGFTPRVMLRTLIQVQ